MFSGENYINSLNMFGIRLGLDAVRDLFAKAGHPEQQLKFIHIAGTNGKGSTGAMLEHAFRGAGFATGFYSSPHLVNIRERFRVNGLSVPEDLFDTMTEELAKAAGDGSYSYFEFTTVLAVQIFCRAGVDVVIWETGMGGRLDATNAVLPQACIITNIALDHQQHLGSTLGAIAGEKAGILKPGVPLFHGKLPQEAKEVIYAKAQELNCPVIPPAADVPAQQGFAGRCQSFCYQGKTYALPLFGAMQRENFRIVYEVIRYFAQKWNFDGEAALGSLKEVRWPGRCQLLPNHLLIDGGHNPDGVTAFVEALQELYPGVRHPVVYGAFRDKDFAQCVKLLSRIASRFIFSPVGADGRPSVPAEELAALAAKENIPAEGAADVHAAIRRAREVRAQEGVAVVSGSLYLIGEVLSKEAPLEVVLNL